MLHPDKSPEKPGTLVRRPVHTRESVFQSQIPMLSLVAVHQGPQGIEGGGISGIPGKVMYAVSVRPVIVEFFLRAAGLEKGC